MDNFFNTMVMDDMSVPLNLATPDSTDSNNKPADESEELVYEPTQSKNPDETMDDKIKDIRDRLEELRNFQLLNQLDIINLKNQIEAKKLFTTGMTIEDEARLTNLIKMSQSAKELDKIRKIAIELQTLKDTIKKENVGGPQIASESIKKELAAIKQKLLTLEKRPSIKQASSENPVSESDKSDIIAIKDSLFELTNRIKSLESRPSKTAASIPALKPLEISIKTPADKMSVQSLLSEMNTVKRYLDILTKRVDAVNTVSARTEGSDVATVPRNFAVRLDELNRKIDELSRKPLKQIGKGKIVRGKISTDQLQGLVNEINQMHDEIDHVIKSTRIDEIEKMIKNNKGVERRLGNLVSEIHGIELIHPLRKYKKETDPGVKKKIASLEKKIKNISEKSKPLKENEKIKHMEKKIEHLEDEVMKFKKALDGQKLMRKKIVKQIKNKVIRLSRTY
ncbi:MAG: hypothetical protein KJ613_02580 [Nanoarchaeota archaeon]|nr:hypothetical protein [Nanoarchaeota archaeon]